MQGREVPRREEEHGGQSSSRWPDLLQPLLHLVLRRLLLQDHFRFGSVCRAWRDALHQYQHDNGPSKDQLPWLFFSPVFPTLPRKPQTFYSLSEERTYHIDIMSWTDRQWVPRSVSRGWVFVTEFMQHTTKSILVNPITGARIRLPPCDENFGQFTGDKMALSSYPTDPKCVILLLNDIWFLLCTLGDQQPVWTAPTPYHPRIIRDIAFCNGRFYALTTSLHLVTLDPIDVKVQSFNMDASQVEGRYSSLYLIESTGELFMVMVFGFHSRRSSPDIWIDVFRADLRERAWLRVRNLGGAAFFVGLWGGSVSIPASKAGERGDRIYFNKFCSRLVSMISDEAWHWMEYDLQNGRSVFHREPSGLESDKLYFMSWIMPSLL